MLVHDTVVLPREILRTKVFTLPEIYVERVDNDLGSTWHCHQKKTQTAVAKAKVETSFHSKTTSKLYLWFPVL